MLFIIYIKHTHVTYGSPSQFLYFGVVHDRDILHFIGEKTTKSHQLECRHNSIVYWNLSFLFIFYVSYCILVIMQSYYLLVHKHFLSNKWIKLYKLVWYNLKVFKRFSHDMSFAFWLLQNLADIPVEKNTLNRALLLQNNHCREFVKI